MTTSEVTPAVGHLPDEGSSESEAVVVALDLVS